MISGQVEQPWFPDVAADDKGDVHVVWNGPIATGLRAYGSQELGALYYSRSSSGRWDPPKDVALIYVGHALRSSVATDQTGRLHLVHKGFGDPRADVLTAAGLGPEDIWYTSMAASESGMPRSWRTRQRLSSGVQGYYSDLAVDSRGTLHVIWTEGGQRGWQLFYRNSTDGGQSWSRQVTLESEWVWWYRAQLKVDLFDNLHVVWETIVPGTGFLSDGMTQSSVYAISRDSGKSWTRTWFRGQHPDLSAAGSFVPGPQQPAVGIDGSGLVLLVFREPLRNQIMFQSSRDGISWSLPQPIPGIEAGVPRGYDQYDMITDSAGRVHLAAAGYLSGSSDPSLIYTVWDRQAWGSPTAVVTAPAEPQYRTVLGDKGEVTLSTLVSTPYPEYPKLALSGGNTLHLVWFGGDLPSIDRTPIGIWYSTALVDAPRVERRAALPVASAVATAAPGPQPAAPGASGAPATETTVPAERAMVGSSPWEDRPGRYQPMPLLFGIGVVALFLIAALAAKFSLLDRTGR